MLKYIINKSSNLKYKVNKNTPIHYTTHVDTKIRVRQNMHITFGVVDSDSNPIEGATVICDGQTKLTNSFGVAVFMGFKSGTFNYQISKAGYSTVTDTITLTNLSKTQTVVLGLASTAVTFTVYDDIGVLLSGASVTVTGVGTETTVVGVATFELMIGTEYNYSVSSDGLVTATGTLTASVGLNRNVNLLYDFHYETIRYHQNILDNTGTISYTSRKNADAYVRNVWNHGTRSTKLNEWIPMGDQLAAALVQLFYNEDGTTKVLGQKVLTNVGFDESAYNESVGFQGDGVGYLKTGFVPSAIDELDLNTTGLLACNSKSNITLNSFIAGADTQSIVTASKLSLRENGNGVVYYGNVNVNTSATTLDVGMIIGYNNAIKNNIYRNTINEGQFGIPTAKPTSELHIFAENRNGTVVGKTDALLSAFAVLTDIETDVSSFPAETEMITTTADDLNNYLKTVGRNEY